MKIARAVVAIVNWACDVNKGARHKCNIPLLFELKMTHNGRNLRLITSRFKSVSLRNWYDLFNVFEHQRSWTKPPLLSK